MKRLLIFLILTLSVMPLFAGLSPSAIYYADSETLRSMCLYRGLPTGTDAEMRNALYEYENLEVYSDTSDSKYSDYIIKILSADSLSNNKDVVTLTGDASISFLENGSSEKILHAGTIIVDSKNKKLTALDEVVFEDTASDASLNSIYADIVTVFWDSGKIYVSEATTSSERKNSDDQSVTFYTTGESLTYFPGGGILYGNGYIASNPETRYSSIKAENIAMLPGEDMFISNAWLSIGRVPILYVPFFFFPGSRITGNPAFGFDSAKGAFLNTTFEIFGVNEDIESSESSSSFTSLLTSNEETGVLYPNGYYYSSLEELTPLQRWAKDSGSFLSVEFDTYKGSQSFNGGGVHLGLDGYITLLNKKLKISVSDGLALSAPVYDKESKLRYYGINSLTYSNSGLKVDASFPFYSDDKVLVDFGNRLYGFSIDPILGKNPEFPTDYKSSISSFTRRVKTSYSLPSKYLGSVVSSLSISDLSIENTYSFDTASKILSDGKNIDNPSRYTYKVTKSTLPSISSNLSGTLFSLSDKITTKPSEEMTEDNSEKPSYSDLHILSDPLLAPLYTENAPKEKSETTSFNTSLKYSISQSFKSSNAYKYGKITDNDKSLSLSSKFTLSSSVSKWFSLSNVLTPSYSFKAEKAYDDSEEEIKETNQLNLNNELSIKIPEVGISYSLSMRLINNKTINDFLVSDGNKSLVSEKKSEFDFGWNKETIYQHKISLSKSFNLGDYTITPSVSYTLKPLVGSLNPKISFKNGPFTLATSWKFVENKETESYEKDMLELSTGYSSTFVTISTSMSYQTKDFDANDFFKPLSINASASIRSKDKKYSLTEAVKYSYYSSKYNFNNYFDSIKTTLSIPHLSSSLNFKTDIGTKNVKFSDFNMKVSYTTDPLTFWKGRVNLKFGISSDFSMDESGFESASFTIAPSLSFSVAEFIDFKFSFSSYNNSFYRYYDDNDQFSVKMMLDDLWRSVDFIGDGRRNTNFVMKNASLEAAHYMEDWDLHCKYSAEVVKSGTEYSLIPKLTVYLAWKTLPELKVDEKWEQKLVNKELEWVKNN